MTVNDVVKEMAQSQGFLMFTAFVVKDSNNMPQLEFRFIRQQYPLEDMKAAFMEFKGLMTRDLNDSGYNLLEQAKKIVTEVHFNDGPSTGTVDKQL